MSMCGALFGTQQLTSLIRKPGWPRCSVCPFPGSQSWPWLSVPTGLYTRLEEVTVCNPNDLNTDCYGSDPNFNTLYTVNEVTGDFTRIG